MRIKGVVKSPEEFDAWVVQVEMRMGWLRNQSRQSAVVSNKFANKGLIRAAISSVTAPASPRRCRQNMYVVLVDWMPNAQALGIRRSLTCTAIQRQTLTPLSDAINRWDLRVRKNSQPLGSQLPSQIELLHRREENFSIISPVHETLRHLSGQRLGHLRQTI